jgi:hypothetical protein
MKTPESMLKLLLSAYAAFLISSGVALFAIPSVTFALYGAPPLNVLESTLAQSLGAVLVGLGAICWMNRARAEKRGPLVLGLIVTNALWTVVCVRAGLSIGFWFFWAEGIGFALVTSLFVAVWYGGER